ncbi:MAG: hypothetical protein U1E05_21690, partial [Patescibacteria group bacterium]|nr:hypothetical protein [Patescibacteria group bacterium]
MNRPSSSVATTQLTRREACRALAGGLARGSLVLGVLGAQRLAAQPLAPWRPNYVLASCMYGKLPLVD